MLLRLLLLLFGWFVFAIAAQACWAQPLKFRKPAGDAQEAPAAAEPQESREESSSAQGSSAQGSSQAAESSVVSQQASGRAGSLATVTKGDGYLPNAHGQQWREYDISPYTARVTSVERPEQAVVDWILRETGTEAWFSEVCAVLNADGGRLIVYHTPEMQEAVAELVDRFVSSQAEAHAFSLQLVTVTSPNWRNKALPRMQRVSVQSPGVDAWLLSKENAAILINDLRKRTDFQEHRTPKLVIENGQSHTLSRTRPRNYVRSVEMRPRSFPDYETEISKIQEGYSLQISPLLSMGGNMIDAVIKCDIDQVEKLVPIKVDLPSANGQRQSVQVQVPQLVSWRLHERFRWPIDQVLLLSCGVVANPAAERASVPFGIPNLLGADPKRADALLFIENRGKADQALVDRQQTAGRGVNNRGRY